MLTISAALEWSGRLGLMAWPLLVCSLLALTIILERSAFYIIVRARRADIWLALSAQLAEYRQQSKRVRDEAVAIALAELQRKYYRGLKLLRFISAFSPLIGLSGTILGIIKMFRVIAEHTGVISPSLIANGLWEALLTTAVGLMIALPCLLMAYSFQAIADGQLSALCSRLNALSLSFESQDKPKSPSSVGSGKTGKIL